ncbi:flagellar assembly protein FliH [Neptunicella sp. SCSIO 80796]|uniref:flagellar assembly protein FliH n=1 Tax=Neptunicella plasticusilytica TaxID=3117012 RepID=UPI003A4D3C84
MSERDTDDELSEAIKAWELPLIEDEEQRAREAGKTNAINKTSNWVYEPPESETEQELSLPTADEIEAIRQAAYQEGFDQGQQEGLQKGQEQGQAEGHQQGYEQGFEQGKDEGLSAGQEESNQQREQWQKLLEQLIKPVEKVDKQLENELVLLATSLAKAVIRCEVTTNQDIIFQALSEGLKVLPIADKQYQIRLHPDDLVLIKQHFSEEDIERHHWRLIETPDMARGGCDIVTDSNAVDLSVERRTRDVLDKFLLQQGLNYQ